MGPPTTGARREVSEYYADRLKEHLKAANKGPMDSITARHRWAGALINKALVAEWRDPAPPKE